MIFINHIYRERRQKALLLWEVGSKDVGNSGDRWLASALLEPPVNYFDSLFAAAQRLFNTPTNTLKEEEEKKEIELPFFFFLFYFLSFFFSTSRDKPLHFIWQHKEINKNIFWCEKQGNKSLLCDVDKEFVCQFNTHNLLCPTFVL